MPQKIRLESEWNERVPDNLEYIKPVFSKTINSLGFNILNPNQSSVAAFGEYNVVYKAITIKSQPETIREQNPLTPCYIYSTNFITKENSAWNALWIRKDFLYLKYFQYIGGKVFTKVCVEQTRSQWYNGGNWRYSHTTCHKSAF